MKKLKYFTTILLALVMLVFTAGCTRTLPLDTPDAASFVIDDSYNLYWKYVPAARSYTVLVTGDDQDYRQEIPSHYTHVSLAHLDEGKYSIRVMASGGSNNEVTSAWSEPYTFDRGHESKLTYTLINGNTEYAVTGIGEEVGDVVIDAIYRGKPVTAIAENAFRGKGNSKITSVKIPEGVRSVGDAAFYNCTNLASISFPASVTSLGAKIFQGCSKLVSVTFAEGIGITSIPDYTFAYCRKLAEISIPEGVTYIGESAFYNCDALADIAFPDSVAYIGVHAFDSDKAMKSVSFGSGIAYIGESSFYNCSEVTELSFKPLTGELVLAAYAFEMCEKLTQVQLPEGLSLISERAFSRCHELETVTIPDSVTEIEANAFYDTKLYNKQNPTGDQTADEKNDGFIYADHWLIGATNKLKLSMEKLTPEMIKEGTVGIADWAFLTAVRGNNGAVDNQGPPNLTEVNLRSSIRYIGANAFYRCIKLTRFSTEFTEDGKTGGLISIGDYAFRGCSILRNVVLREGLLEIGSYAFRDCSILTDNGANMIPKSVRRIGTRAYLDSGLWLNAREADGIAYAGNWVVGFNTDTSSSHSEIAFKDGVVGVADFAFYNNEELTRIQKLNSAEHIGRGAFFGCTALGMVSLNQNLTEIADNTFSGCSSLAVVNFPFSLKRIGLRAFYQCTLLDDIDLSATDVEEIGEMAFYGCTNVKEIGLGGKLQTIGSSSFNGLEQIEEVVLPDSVTDIGANAFAGCTSLTAVTLSGSLQAVGAGAFQGCESLASVTIPDNVTEIGNYAFYKCGSLATADLGSNTVSIGTYAFGATALTSLVLPASVKEIGDYAFKSTNSLTSVLMLGIPDAIGMHAFYGSSKLTFYIAGSEEAANSKQWSSRWNSAFRPVVWEAAVNAEEGYLVSFTTAVTPGYFNPANPFARFGLSAPVREGYDFAGWATSPGGEAVYGVDEWRKAEIGTTFYAVWTEHTAAPSETPSGTPEETEQN